MKDGPIRRLFGKVGILSLYGSFLEWRKKNRGKPDHWYYRFLPIQNKKAVFCNISGKSYGDNPRAITEEILRQGLNWDLVWLLNKEENLPPQVRQVIYGSPQAKRELATAKMWVFSNRNVSHPHKRRGQKYLQAWHGGGVLVKRIEGMAMDTLSPSYISAAKEDGRISDYILSSDSIRTQVIRDYFWIGPQTQILEFGTPKDDIFFQQEEMQRRRKEIRQQYGIDDQTYVILYMPTFRNDLKSDAYTLDYERVLQAFREVFQTECCLFLRLHPLVPPEAVDCNGLKGVVNVSAYPEANDLFAAADCAISDYTSSPITKMPMLHKPSFIFASDYEDYKESRGLTEYYAQLPIPICETNEQLLQQIRNYNPDTYFATWDEYYREHPSFECGQASYRTVELMKTIMGK